MAGVHGLIAEAARPLAVLREDIEIVSQDDDRQGQRFWTVFDPLRHRFFRLNWQSVDLLRQWPKAGTDRTAEQLARVIDNPSLGRNEIEALESFLVTNQLTEVVSRSAADEFYRENQNSKQSWWKWLVHNYLFLKIPLTTPASFLKRTYPSLRWIFDSRTLWVILIGGFVALYLLVRQWSEFVSTFVYFFTIEGLAGYGLALVVVKVLHELGHAYVLTHYGGRVHSIGVAFIVMFPVLYTDTSDAWRLTSRRQKLHVGAAGMATELVLALISTLMWALLDDGVLRSIAFFLATTGWISSFLVNLNPFMRFDGYYLLSDALRVENLQNRAFIHGKAELRHQLFGLPREGLTSTMMKIHGRLVAYAWLTWLYRLVVFIGIAIIVYAFFFKVLGVILFVVEILWFILLPVVREVKVWWSQREDIVLQSRSKVVGVTALILVLLFVLPWSSSVSVQGVLVTDELKKVYTPVAGRVVKLNLSDTSKVKAGQLLLELEDTDTALQLERKQAELAVVGAKIRVSEFDDERLEDLASLRSEKRQHEVDIAGLENLQSRQRVIAERDGMIRDVNPHLIENRWIDKGTRLFTHIYGNKWSVRAYVMESEIARLKLGQVAIFYPEDPSFDSIQLSLTDISAAGAPRLEHPMLAGTYGGELAVHQTEAKGLVPDGSVYELEFALADEQWSRPTMQVRGMVRISAERRSFFEAVFSRAGSVIRREFGI